MYAVIDIGSNTIRLSLYQVTDGKITPMVNKKVTAGLAGYTQNSHMSEEGIQRGENALEDLTKLLSYIHVKKLFCFATAPLRGIDNAEEVKARFEKVCNSPITILSGEEEAQIDFLGAKQNLDNNEGLMVDIGGGSTELVYYSNGKIRFTRSLPFGSLVMYRKFVKDIIPSIDEMALIMDKIEKELNNMFPPVKIPVIYGIGGTVRGCGKILSNVHHDKKKANQYTTEDLDELLKVDRQNIVDLIIKSEPERIHTILPGSCILLAVAKYFQAKKIRVSKTGVREGCLMLILKDEEEGRK